MKLISTLIFVLVVIATVVRAQNPQIKLYGERTNNSVRLAWVPKVWPSTMEGVIIKRRIGTGAWQDVTDKMVVPSSYVGKDLSNVEQLSTERQRLDKKLSTMVAEGQAKPMSEKEYFDNILLYPAKLSGISFVFAIDYDLMLLNGFGCTDRKNIDGNNIEYGLFPVIEGKMHDKPLVIYQSLADDKPDFDLDVTTEVEAIGNNAKLRLHWYFDLMKYREKQIKGFNIYRQTKGKERVILNKRTIWITSNNNPVDLNYIIDFPDTDIDFYAVPVSYFGTEGQGFKLSFNPAAYTITIPAPALIFTLDQQSLSLNWQLDHGYDSLINKFKVMRKEVGKDYEQKGILNSTDRSYTAQLPETGERARYKIITVSVTGREVWSNEVNINYVPATAVPAPENLQGEIIQKDGINYIQLTWEYMQPTDGIVFRIMSEGPSGNLIWDSSYPKDLTSPFAIEVKRSIARLERFAIVAHTADKRNSLLSNEFKIITPTRSLPPVFITSLTLVDGKAKIDWQFSKDILDLEGFRILVDDEIYLTEKEISSDLRSYTLNGLSPGKHYINIIAITLYGKEKFATKKSIIIP